MVLQVHGLLRTLAVFQQLDVDYTLSKPHATLSTVRAKRVPVIRLFGVTEAGRLLQGYGLSL